MDASTLESKLQLAFNEGLNLPAGTDYPSLQFAKSLGWDSVAHLRLIAAIENTFGIMMSTQEILGLNSYPKAIETVRKYVSPSA